MIKKLKKLLGICEHKWEVCSYSTRPQSDKIKGYVALRFGVDIICQNCGKHKIFKSDYFNKSGISNNVKYLSQYYNWNTMESCEDALMKTHNAKIVLTSFAIKCKNKYGINIKEQNWK